MVRDIDGKILFWNKGAEFVYGWTRGEAIGRNGAELCYSDSKKFDEINALTISRGEWQGEVQNLTKNGREISGRRDSVHLPSPRVGGIRKSVAEKNGWPFPLLSYM